MPYSCKSFNMMKLSESRRLISDMNIFTRAYNLLSGYYEFLFSFEKGEPLKPSIRKALIIADGHAGEPPRPVENTDPPENHPAKGIGGQNAASASDVPWADRELKRTQDVSQKLSLDSR